MIVKSTKLWSYNGPYNAVDVHLPTRWITIERAGTIQLTPAEAKAVSLLPGWNQVTDTNIDERAY